MWNPWKWRRWTYLRGKNRGANVENRLVGTGVGRLGLPGRSYSHTPVRRTDSWWELLAQGPRLGAVVPGRVGRGQGGSRGRGTHACVRPSHLTAQRKPARHCKANMFQLFKKRKNKNNQMLGKRIFTGLCIENGTQEF